MFVFFSVKKMPPLRKPGATKKTYRKQQRQVEMLTFFIENRVMWNRIGTINWLVKSVLHDTFSSNHKNVGKNYQTFSCLSKAFQVLRIISTYKHQNASTESEAVGYLSRLSLNHIFLLSQKKTSSLFWGSDFAHHFRLSKFNHSILHGIGTANNTCHFPPIFSFCKIATSGHLTWRENWSQVPHPLM